MAVGRDLQGEDFKVVAIIGDGALTGGMALEALLNIGDLKTDMVVVLNDNNMSIAENVGAMATLSFLRVEYSLDPATRNDRISLSLSFAR